MITLMTITHRKGAFPALGSELNGYFLCMQIQQLYTVLDNRILGQLPGLPVVSAAARTQTHIFTLRKGSSDNICVIIWRINYHISHCKLVLI